MPYLISTAKLWGYCSFGSPLILSLTFVVVVFVLKLLKTGLFGPLRHVPGPFLTRVSGAGVQLSTIAGRRVYKLERLHAEYGPIVRIGPNEVSLGGWENLRKTYSNSIKGPPKDPNFYSAGTFVGKPNIFQMSDPHRHAARRKLSSPPYSLQSVGSLEPIIASRVDALAKRLEQGAAISPSATVDAFKLCGLFSFEVICSAGFGKKAFDDSVDGEDARLLEAMDASALTMIFGAVLPFLGASGLATKLPGMIGNAYRSLAYWQERSRDMVDSFLRNSSDDEKLLLTPLSQGVDSFLGRKLTNEELLEEAMGYMFAGSGTTSSTLTYLLFQLSKQENQGIQERLRGEILKMPLENSNAVRQCSFLRAVIKETMRLHPTIISTLPRVLIEPLQVGKYSLPAGTIVGMQNWIHHRDPMIFPDPDKFHPDRWTNATDLMEQSLTPFSIGRRNCIGQNLAWEELLLAVSSLMRRGLQFQLSSEMNDWEMEMEDRFNIAPRGKRLLLRVTRV